MPPADVAATVWTNIWQVCDLLSHYFCCRPAFLSSSELSLGETLHTDEAIRSTGCCHMLRLPMQSVLQDIIGNLACRLAVPVFSNIHQRLSALVCPVLTCLSLHLWLAHSGLVRACVQRHLGSCFRATPGFSAPKVNASATICFHVDLLEDTAFPFH